MATRDPRPSPKDEVARAIAHVRARLADGAPLDPLNRRILAETLVYAAEQLEGLTVARVRKGVEAR